MRSLIFTISIVIFSLTGPVSESFALDKLFQISGATTSTNLGNSLLCITQSSALVGEPGPGGGNNGAVQLYTPVTGVLSSTFTGPTGGGRMGFSLAIADDIDNDTQNEFVTGAPQMGSTFGNGWAYLYSLAGSDSGTGGPIAGVNGFQLGEGFGFAVNGFGVAVAGGGVHFLASAPFRYPQAMLPPSGIPPTGSADGAVEVVRVNTPGNTNSIPSSPRTGFSTIGSTLIAPVAEIRGTTGENLGISLTEMRDLNGDSINDIVASGPGYNGGVGRVTIFSGICADGVNNCVELTEFSGTGTGTAFGESIANVGDVNKDGGDDILVGAPKDSVNGTDSGTATLFSSKGAFTSGSTPVVLCILHGGSPGEEFGRSVAALGDINRDGVEDFAVGAPGANQTTGGSRGRVYLYSYISGNCQAIGRIDGGTNDLRLGERIANKGRPALGECDFNTDGFADVGVGIKNGSKFSDSAGAAGFFAGDLPTGSALHVSLLTDSSGQLKVTVDSDKVPPVGCDLSITGRVVTTSFRSASFEILNTNGATLTQRTIITAPGLPAITRIDGERPIIQVGARILCDGQVRVRSAIQRRYLLCSCSSSAVSLSDFRKALTDSLKFESASISKRGRTTKITGIKLPKARVSAVQARRIALKSGCIRR